MVNSKMWDVVKYATVFGRMRPARKKIIGGEGERGVVKLWRKNGVKVSVQRKMLFGLKREEERKWEERSRAGNI